MQIFLQQGLSQGQRFFVIEKMLEVESSKVRSNEGNNCGRECLDGLSEIFHIVLICILFLNIVYRLEITGVFEGF